MRVKYFYDLQKTRISSHNRALRSVPTTELSDADKAFLQQMGDGLSSLEDDVLKTIKKMLKGIPIYEQWFSVRPDQKGIGPTMAALILTSFNIENCSTVSKMWAWAGLAVDPTTGRAVQRVKGERARFDPWLKSKMVTVLPECLIKANSPWKKTYDDYKHRKTSQMVPTCFGCEGTGKRKGEAREDPKTGKIESVDEGKLVKCWNCDGTGGPAPWGRGPDHRHMAAKRYLAKMVLQALWVKWRTIEGLEVRPPYAEEKLGMLHHGQSALVQSITAPIDEVDAELEMDR